MLLQALLGELELISGQVKRSPAQIAYCSQDPVLLPARTIRDNICWLKPFNQKLYTTVLQATALAEDVAQFGEGDQRTCSRLSGGQVSEYPIENAMWAESPLRSVPV